MTALQSKVCQQCKLEGHMAGDCKVPDKCRKYNEKGTQLATARFPTSAGSATQRVTQPGTGSSQIPESVAERRFTWLLNAARLSRLLVLLQRINGPQDLCVKNTGDAEIYNEVHNITSGINFNKQETIEVKMKGENVPWQMESFVACRLCPLVVPNITKPTAQN